MRRCTISVTSSGRHFAAPPRTWGSTGLRAGPPRTGKIMGQHRVEVALADDLPMLEIDAVLFEQVLFNLLDNAAKYGAPGTAVRIQGWRDGPAVYLQVLDEGGGIPPEHPEHSTATF